MYTILVCDNNDLYGSQKERIMQKEKLFNRLQFLVAPHYNGYDMSKCTVTMRYMLPISKEFNTETLSLSEERYEGYLKYVLPIDTKLSKEWGDIELNLTFTMLDFDNDGNIIQRVRKTNNHVLHITKIPDWDAIVPDSALSALDQRILKQDAQMRVLSDLANALGNNQVDNLVYDNKSETLQLHANGVGIGDKVSVKDMMSDGIPVVDLDSGSNKPNIDNNNGCDCGDCNCEDNVIDFGYLNGSNGQGSQIEIDDNIAEFY